MTRASTARSCLKTNKSNYTSAGVYVLRFGTDEGEAPVSPAGLRVVVTG